MRGEQRIFVEAVRRYCARHAITVELRSGGWLIVMHKGGRRHFALGYDIGLNSAIAHRIASDKAATADILALAGIPAVAHTLFSNPARAGLAPQAAAQAAMRDLLRQHEQGLVIKPNTGSSGQLVFRARDATGLARATEAIFTASLDVAIAPFVTIEEEVRVVLLDGQPLVVYSKQRGADWHHNLGAGATALLLDRGEMREACAAIAARATSAIGIRFASVDVIRVEGRWLVLEINSGVMMEALGRQHRKVVEEAYAAALDAVFA
ncbi:RimK-like protein [Bradyrhizobium sp. NP1]|uniref:ATP-grasp domain-containing protein n=1 Tax=Bradyrhizobium sp. NP1 TaxID=3049772 RepID=UPI0025A5F472|nr:RimK-like protein [Bradyrhizobium sp. NP1]WJR78015.1 RimK-like protein [Bradyrhizobium sp. NP1]